jgi:amidase
MDLHDLTAVEQARAIRRGETSSVELTEHYLRRSHDLTATVGAFVTITDDLALEQARADAASSARGCRARQGPQ